MHNAHIFSLVFVFAITGSSPMHGMLHKSIQKQIDKVTERFIREEWLNYTDYSKVHENCLKHNQDIADIVHTAGDLMSDEQKLDYLWGDSRREERKIIIHQMIEGKKVDPTAPQLAAGLWDSVLHEDLPFTTYLLAYGVIPGKGALEWAQESPMFTPLFLKYKDMVGRSEK
jgi:hypothetical protein